MVGPKDANLAKFIHPAHFQSVIAAAKQVAGFSEVTHLFKTLSLALKVGHSVKQCAKILKGIALQNGDEIMLTQSSRFLTLSEDLWTEEIYTHASRSLGETKKKPSKINIVDFGL